MVYEPSLLTKAYASPPRYYQGPGLAEEVAPKVASSLGDRVLILGGQRSLEALRVHGLFRALDKMGLFYKVEEFGKDQSWGKECCYEEVYRLAEIADDSDCDMIMAAGGGKVIDTGKAISKRLNLPLVSFPTVASSDAPTSSLSAMYTTGHRFREYSFYDTPPDVVLVDTSIIAEAPPRFLACGIGDAFSKRFEVDACYRSGNCNQIERPWGGFSPLVCAHLAVILGSILKMWGREAMSHVRKQMASPALEAIVEGNVLISGLAFESGGLAAAHSIYDGLTLLEEKMKPHQYHGELVHFGTCVQVLLEDQPRDVVYEVFKFGHEIGLPETLGDIGLSDVGDEELWRAAEKAASEGETIHKMPMEVTPENVFHALKAADEFGRSISGMVPRTPYT